MKYWLSLVMLLTALCAQAQGLDDSYDDVATTAHKKFYETKSFEILHVGVPMIAIGLAFQPSKENFQQLRNSYIPNTRVYVDDYIQYAPAALMLGLKGFGVESRSSWGRMLTSDVFSVALVTLSVNSVKRATKIVRPDSDADNSFPSGHTTTAFMTATMLHKEFGAVSPWYSVAGYTAATTTALLRMANNRHWVSDVCVGAGLGIISTELGYLFADLIFKDRGINKELDRYESISWFDIEKPSSVGLYLGAMAPLGSISDSVKLSRGSHVGVDGAYFFNRNIGLGGDLSIATSSVKVDGVTSEEVLDTVSAKVGGYFAKPLSRHWRIGAKGLAGANFYNGLSSLFAKGAHPTVGTGVAMEYLSNRHFSMKAFCNYNATCVSTLPKSNIHQTATIGFVSSIIF